MTTYPDMLKPWSPGQIVFSPSGDDASIVVQYQISADTLRHINAASAYSAALKAQIAVDRCINKLIKQE
jgi:hypothetical protein